MSDLTKQRVGRAVDLLASAARTASENGDEKRIDRTEAGLIATLDVTVDESTAADKLDVKIQTKPNGQDWVDVVSFTQHDGNVGAKRYVAKVSATEPQAMFTDAALAAGSVRHLIGDQWRAVATVTDDSGNASFTFSVSLLPI
jgi:hypothetical protein